VRDLGTRFAVDVARSGDDETVVVALRPAARGGHVARVVHAARGHDLMRTTGEVARLLAAEPRPAVGDHVVVVDAVGLGQGVHDRLAELGVPVVDFKGSRAAVRPDRFANRRAESYWALREALIAGEVDLDPADDDLAAQLGGQRYALRSSGAVLIESKAEMRRRGLPSPDRADALAMAVGAVEATSAASAAAVRSAPWEVFDGLRAQRDRAEARLGAVCDRVNRMAAAELAGCLDPGDAVLRPRLVGEVAELRREIERIDDALGFERDFGAGWDGRALGLPAPVTLGGLGW
jgi:hypothetical protein